MKSFSSRPSTTDVSISVCRVSDRSARRAVQARGIDTKVRLAISVFEHRGDPRSYELSELLVPRADVISVLLRSGQRHPTASPRARPLETTSGGHEKILTMDARPKLCWVRGSCLGPLNPNWTERALIGLRDEEHTNASGSGRTSQREVQRMAR